MGPGASCPTQGRQGGGALRLEAWTVGEAMAAYPCENWETGWKTLANGEEIYFVRNAALGLWQYDGE